MKEHWEMSSLTLVYPFGLIEGSFLLGFFEAFVNSIISGTFSFASRLFPFPIISESEELVLEEKKHSLYDKMVTTSKKKGMTYLVSKSKTTMQFVA